MFICALHENISKSFTFFSSSFALAWLVSTLVWSTMLSADKKKEKGSERQSAKGPARHSCVVIAPFSLAHAACANTFWKPDAGECVHRDVWGASIPFVPITLLNQELQRWDHVTNTSFGFCRLNTASRFKLSMRVGSLVSTACPVNLRSTYTSLS